MLLSLLALGALQTSPGLELWPEDDAEARRSRDAAIVRSVTPDHLREWHNLIASRPHPAGSEGDAQVIASIAGAFDAMGLEVKVHRFTAYLSRPVSASLRLTAPSEVDLPLTEMALPGSTYSELDDDLLRLGWNAYSGSGVAEGQVVYANHGRKEDFEKLTELGVDCGGKIVLARYGGNFRGYKAKFAEAAGAAGLIIFTDPKDSGYGRGLETPEGGWANCDQIQRGSLKTLPWSGDPLTPGIEATADAARLDPDDIALPRIPVQPVGWQAAAQIMAPMDGASVPKEWQGGMPFRYRLEGGPSVRVRLEVQQERSLVETANVLGTLRGALSRDGAPGIIVGAHHDAWVYGADDPTSGTIAMLETARTLTGQAEASGVAPRRTVTFAAWGAEEHGIIGSCEWVEGNRQALIEGADLYINLDAAASGLRLGVSASPSLTSLLHGAAAAVPQPGTTPTVSALDAWRGEGDDLPEPGFLGGGSDHVSFLALCSIPSASIGARGAPGTAYHSLYDDLAWYRRVVGADYGSAGLITRITSVAVDRASTALVLPIDLDRPALALARAAGTLLEAEPELFGPAGLGALIERAEEQAVTAGALGGRLRAAARSGALDDARCVMVDELLRGLERAWLSEAGLPERPWYRNLYTAPDESSGYAAWPLPGLQKASADSDARVAKDQVASLSAVLQRRAGCLAALSVLIENALDR